MYYKIHDRRKFYFTLCQTAKRNQCYNLIQSTQMILPLQNTTVKHWRKINSTLAPNSTFSQSNTFRFRRLSRFRLSFVVVVHFLFFICFAIERAYTVYIDKSHVSTNLLVYVGLSSNSLERALRLNAPEHSTISEL